jgi:ABC-type Fe3+-hydroxamate transport system substrate-binding protein
MKNIILFVLAIAVVFMACNSNSDKAKETTPVKTTTMDTTQKPETMNPVAEQLYACPMHPEVTGKKDEKCSKCGMKLTVPVKNSDTPK